MLPFKLVYHPNYDLNLGPHVFPSQKFRLIQLMLLHEGIAGPEDFVLPEEASDVDLLRVHTPEWIGKLRNGTLTASEIMKLEVPYSPELARAWWMTASRMKNIWKRCCRRWRNRFRSSGPRLFFMWAGRIRFAKTNWAD